MVVGIDVHKRAHVAALVDERGGELGTLSFANSPKGCGSCGPGLSRTTPARRWSASRAPAGYGRLLVASLEAEGHDVLDVPAWRTHRERRRHGPGKTDPGDAIAIAQVVLRKRDELGPALEPELVRALALLELQRRRLVRDRTQAIQRLRADWNQVDPVGEARVVNLTASASCSGSGGSASATAWSSRPRPAASASSPATSKTSTSASPPSTRRSPSCSPSTATPSPTCTAPDRSRRRADRPGRRRAPLPRRRRLRALLRRRANPLRLGPDRRPPPAAPRRQPPTQRRPLPDRDRPSPPRPPARATSPARSPKARRRVKRAERSNATSPTSSTDASTPGQKPPRHSTLDIGESSASSAPCSPAGPTAPSTLQPRTHPRP